MLITYLAVYIGFVFLIATAAVLAIQQLSEAADSQERYRLLARLGCDERMLSRSVLVQVLVYFLSPLALAVCHSACAISVMSDSLFDLLGVEVFGPHPDGGRVHHRHLRRVHARDLSGQPRHHAPGRQIALTGGSRASGVKREVASKRESGRIFAPQAKDAAASPCEAASAGPSCSRIACHVVFHRRACRRHYTECDHRPRYEREPMEYQKLQDEIKAAMKARDAKRRDILRQVHTELKAIEVNERRDVTEADVDAMLKRVIKQTKETLDGSIKAGNNQERTDTLSEQVAILEEYLPKQVSGR